MPAHAGSTSTPNREGDGIGRQILAGRELWIVALLAALLLWAPLRSGDLAGFDDALYATIAKDMLHSGNWLDERVSGELAVETHPPMLEWMQGSLFKSFGVSDTAARVPSAICGFGTILLVFWLTRRLT